jgi:hypothetical protein
MQLDTVSACGMKNSWNEFYEDETISTLLP